MNTERVNLFDQIESNKRNSILLTAIVLAVVLLFAYTIAQIFDPASASLFLLVAIVIMTIDIYTSYYHGDRVVLSATKARPANPRVVAEKHLVDVVGAYFPAVLGALVVVPVYFIGKALVNRWLGLLAAAIIAVLPGEFMGRSILGFTDHHIAESLFSTIVLLFTILAVKSGAERNISLQDVAQRNWSSLNKPVLYAALAGLSLGIYLITWTGSLLFVFIIALYLLVQFVSDHLRSKSGDYLMIVGTVIFFISALMAIPLGATFLYQVSLPAALVLTLALGLISRWISAKGLKPVYYPVSLTVLGLIALFAFRSFYPSLFHIILIQFSLFSPTGSSAQTTLEMQRMLFPNGQFSWLIAWGNYNITFFTSILMLLVLIHFLVRGARPESNLWLVWSLVILAATLGQRRFGYYLAVNIALLGGYAFWLVLSFAGSRITRLIRESRPESGKSALKSRRKAPKRRLPLYQLASFGLAGLVGLVALSLSLFWDIKGANDIGQEGRFAPSDAWCNALSWVKNNTPEPFGDPAFYYKEYGSSADFKYPSSAYGVAAWWDYGYWITRMAHRIPIANPGQSPEPIRDIARLFMSQDESTAAEAMKKMQASHIIIDYKTVTSIYWAIIVWNQQNMSNFSGIYYIAETPQDSQLHPVQLFYPEYYRSMAVRLYNFDAKPVTAPKPIVITYKDSFAPDGTPYKLVTIGVSFQSYADALAYVQNQKDAKTRIVSENPFISPVPLEGLEGFSLAYSSPGGIQVPDAGNMPEVKVFKYLTR